MADYSRTNKKLIIQLLHRTSLRDLNNTILFTTVHNQVQQECGGNKNYK